MLGSLISGGASILGGLFGKSSADADRAYQKKFAQNSVQWRAADAKKAGLHPLATMGYSGSSYTPVGDGGMGAAVSQAGQQLGSGIAAAPKNKLASAMAQSSMSVDAANVELLKAQKLQIMDNIRKSIQGTKGLTTALPQPGSAKQFGGKDIPYMPGTSPAQEIEDKHGGAIGDILSAIATLNAVDVSKDNPFFTIKNKLGPYRNKSTAKTHQSKRW